VTGALLDEAEARFHALLSGKETDAKELGKRIERMVLLLRCLEGREDARTERLLLKMFEALGRLAALKGTPGGGEVIERLVVVMAEGPPRARSALIDAHATLPAEGLGQAFAAARKSRPPAEVFAAFSPYLTARVDEKKKHRDPAWAKRQAIIEQLTSGPARACRDAEGARAFDGLDPRWLDLAVRLDRLDLVQALAAPGHDGAGEFLATRFRLGLGRSGGGPDYELLTIVETLVQVGHPGATDAVIELIKRIARSKAWYAYYGFSDSLGRLLPRLPRAEALPKLEALLPTLPENLIDQLLDHVTEMKQGTPTATTT
jgi:hypothetical protein